jgi:hypothetical protein
LRRGGFFDYERAYFVVEDLSLSASLEELEPDGLAALDEPLEDGVDEDEDDGVLEEPAPAAPPLVPELEGAAELLEDAPPLAGLFVESLLEEELEPEGLALGVLPAADEDDEPGVALGAEVVPLALDEEPEGDEVAPEGEVDEELEERSAARSHAVISDAPSARETATASVESLMWPPWLGYWITGARIGPSS